MAIEDQPGCAVDLHSMNDGVLVAISGELDVVAAPYVRERLVHAVRDDPGTVRIDLSEVSFLDSTAVGLLVSAKRGVSAYGGTFSVKCRHPPVRLVLETTGLIKYLNVDPMD